MPRTPTLALVLALVAAGCVTTSQDHDADPTDDPLAEVFVCDGRPCNLLATVAPQTRQANELSVAVNPLDPLNIIATGKDYTPEEAGDCVWSGIYTTLDGGKTWTNQNVPGSPWKRLQDPTTPVTPFSKFWCATDPVVAFGPDGTAYWTVMPYQCDRASGSKTGRGVHPDGGFNDWFWTCSSMYVLVSHDGGLTWPVDDVREVAFGPRLEHDKQWISVAPDGRLLLCWDRSPFTLPDPYPTPEAIPRPDRAVVVGEFAMVCSASTDGAKTWTPLREVDFLGWLPWIDHGPDNVAWMAAINATHVLVSRSDDGLHWEPPVAVGTYLDPPPGGEYGWPVLRGSDFRMFAVPSIAVDRSDGPYRGSVYVTWFDHSSGEGDVLFAYSRDGKTWSTPKRVHDDAPEATADQFMPVVSVGPDGTVDLSWHDRRDDPANHLFHLYHAYSLDGGETISPNQRISDVASDEQFSHHQNGMVFLGDYRDSDSTHGRVVLTWTDTRHQKADVMVASVMRPSANEAR